MTEFECGACPECLKKRASRWALRAVYESKQHGSNIMVTLTYDNYIRDKNGNIVRDNNGVPLELPPDSTLSVDKRHIQLFIKRLRKHFKDRRIKYIVTAEYGSRTHRAHYHAILFNVDFTDKRFLKRSKRGNPIYSSPTLTKLWGHGLCTIDSIRVQSSVARYCTKYCAKTRSENTFMLFSQGIGTDELLSDFNGFSYMVSGHEHPVPRGIWEAYIVNKYRGYPVMFSPKYKNKTLDTIENGIYDAFCEFRERYRNIRDNDAEYQRYLSYWREKTAQFKARELSVRERIILLPDDKYHFYRIDALAYLSRIENGDYSTVAPRSNAGKRVVYDYFMNSAKKMKMPKCAVHLPWDSCPYTASDTKAPYDISLYEGILKINKKNRQKLLTERWKNDIIEKKGVAYVNKEFDIW